MCTALGKGGLLAPIPLAHFLEIEPFDVEVAAPLAGVLTGDCRPLEIAIQTAIFGAGLRRDDDHGSACQIRWELL